MSRVIDQTKGAENFPVDVPGDQKKDFYVAARAEVVQRLALRDQSLFAYIVAAGTYIGFILQPKINQNNRFEDVFIGCALTLVLPILSLVFAYVILQHHIMIGRLGDYVRMLYPDHINHWDRYYITWKDRSYLKARTMSQALLLSLPVCYAGVFFLSNFRLITSSPLLKWVAGITGLCDILVIIYIVVLHIQAYKIRRQTDFPRLMEEPVVEAGPS